MIVVVVTATLALAAAPTARQEPRVTAVVQVVEACTPAVVNVSATHVVTESASPFDFFASPLETRERKASSVGSGSVIHERGYVLTNAHVVASASELTVTTSSGKTWPAHVVAALPADDLAIVKVELPQKEALPALVLGRSDDVMVGESVVAIGNPVGLGHTVTTGIVSAVQREITPRADVKMTGLLQTDAAINPGNSGGPLLNVVGEQIGVNTAIRGDAQNVGFAIGVDRVRNVLPQLLAVENRALQNGTRLLLGLGLSVRLINDEEALVVTSVAAGSPAAKAKIEHGSVVVSVEEATGLVPALVALHELAPGQKATVRLRLPEGSVDVVELQVQERPPPDGPAIAKDRLGLTLADLDTATAMRLGLRGGLVVKAVEGPAQKANLQPGDLVVRIGNFGARSSKDLALLEGLAPGDDVSLRVVRIGQTRVGQNQAGQTRVFAAEVVLRAR